MLSKTAEYALRAITCMGGQIGIPASADLLAEKTKVPRRYLTRVLQELASKGLVQSRPGPGGGYELKRKPKEITILDTVNAVSPIERIQTCPLGLQSHNDLCPLHDAIDKAYAATEAAFASVSIQDLIDATSPVHPLCESQCSSGSSHDRTGSRRARE
ncbi:Rrf2 family transcriptional regulator [Novipirellula artificiosorum]|uniref:Iron-responsive transcriptional regulator n=1 Tax=Novipirellula artificiosorum TaxID=2528016 RepID=A0A5C6DZJ8_9BACT|nr:Rrf2 family transcriptional regulator [Novipirellula artificiosorum]TWU40486.1 iron-responsive transcriptional regulator [Novipirellula artificiosorum]